MECPKRKGEAARASNRASHRQICCSLSPFPFSFPSSLSALVHPSSFSLPSILLSGKRVCTRSLTLAQRSWWKVKLRGHFGRASTAFPVALGFSLATHLVFFCPQDPSVLNPDPSHDGGVIDPSLSREPSPQWYAGNPHSFLPRTAPHYYLGSGHPVYGFFQSPLRGACGPLAWECPTIQ